MKDRLLVAVLGHRKAGKSTTRYELFGERVRTRATPRRLVLPGGRSLDVFVVSGSAEERKLYVGDLIPRVRPHVVLCAIQYVEEGFDSFNFFFDHGYTAFVQWLNPGRHDGKTAYFDRLGMLPWLVSNGATIAMRNGRVTAGPRVAEIREYLLGWAEARDLA